MNNVVEKFKNKKIPGYNDFPGIRKMQTASGGPINYKRWDDAKITSYTIPFIKEKAIKLTNAGRATGAVLSTNLLDSLADNAIRAGVPIRTAIGISTKESTLGNPTDDRSAWNISSKIRKLFNGIYPGTVQHINNGTNLVNGINLINYHKGNIDHEMFNGAQGKSIIQEGLEFYKTHPNKYNPGLKGYQKAVDSRGEEVMNSPEVLKWYREWERSKAQIFRPEPYKINTNIQNTALEFVSRNKQGGKMNILEFLKNGGQVRKMLTAAGGPIYSNGQYKIPRKRKVINTIKLNNGVLTYEVDNLGNRYWFRNGKYLTPTQIKNYKYYDPEIKAYRKLDILFDGEPTGTTFVHTPTIDHLNNRKYELELKSNDSTDKQIFVPNNKIITLKTRGKMNLTSIPTNVLDTIAVNAGRAGTNIKTALGLIGKESTFGGASIPLGRHPKDIIYNPYTLTNNHAYFISPEAEYINQLYKNVDLNDKERVNIENKAAYDLAHNLIKGVTPHYSENIMADAFERYDRNPEKYNPGQANYVSMVTNIGNEIFGYKPIQDWYNTEGVKYYNRGLSERYKQGGKMNIIEFLKNGSGIHIKPENRGKFTKYCHGKVTSECIARGKRSSDPAIRKRATFADNARHFKHKEGGKAFVNGVNVLDSNPKMSKAASRRVKKADDGTKLNAFLKVLNSDTGKTIGRTLMNGLSAGFQAKQMNDAINEYELASKAKLKKIMNGISTKDYYDQVLLQMNPNENLSLVVLNTRAYALALQDALKKVNEAKDESDLQLNKLKQLASEQNLYNLSNVLGGISLLGSLLNNKPASKVDNGTPSNSYFDNYANNYTKQLFNIKS